MRALLFPIWLLLASQAGAIGIDQALKLKMVQVEITGDNFIDNTTYQSTHSGACMRLTIKNISTKTATVDLETGRIFLPEDVDLQPMLVTKHRQYKINPGGKVDEMVYAMCFNDGKQAPGEKAVYHIGKMATDWLLEAAQYVEKNNLQDYQGQSLVWDATRNKCFSCVLQQTVSQPVAEQVPSDSHPVHTVIQEAPFKEHDPYEPLKSDTVMKIFNNWYNKVDVTFAYTLHDTSKVRIEMVDERGKLIKVLQPDTMQNPGMHKVNEVFVVDKEWKIRKCIMKLYVNDQYYTDREIHIPEMPINGF
jgi:hypothetical protein